MTVKELINWLSDFDEDKEVVIGMVQHFGSDFAMEIDGVSEEHINYWEDGEEETCIVITEGPQIGSVCYLDDYYDA